MKSMNEQELRELLSLCRAPEPGPFLVERTKTLMFEELRSAAAPSPAVGARSLWGMALAGLTVAMSLCVFWMLTVGTVLKFILPMDVFGLVYKSLYALTAAGGSLLAGLLMVMYCLYIQNRHTGREPKFSEVYH